MSERVEVRREVLERTEAEAEAALIRRKLARRDPESRHVEFREAAYRGQRRPEAAKS